MVVTMLEDVQDVIHPDKGSAEKKQQGLHEVVESSLKPKDNDGKPELPPEVPKNKDDNDDIDR